MPTDDETLARAACAMLGWAFERIGYLHARPDCTDEAEVLVVYWEGRAPQSLHGSSWPDLSRAMLEHVKAQGWVATCVSSCWDERTGLMSHGVLLVTHDGERDAYGEATGPLHVALYRAICAAGVATTEVGGG